MTRSIEDDLAEEMAKTLRTDHVTFGMMAATVHDKQLQKDMIAEGKRRRDLALRYSASKQKGDA